MQAAGAEISLRYDDPMAVVGQLCTPLLVGIAGRQVLHPLGNEMVYGSHLWSPFQWWHGRAPACAGGHFRCTELPCCRMQPWMQHAAAAAAGRCPRTSRTLQ